MRVAACVLVLLAGACASAATDAAPLPAATAVPVVVSAGSVEASELAVAETDDGAGFAAWAAKARSDADREQIEANTARSSAAALRAAVDVIAAKFGADAAETVTARAVADAAGRAAIASQLVANSAAGDAEAAARSAEINDAAAEAARVAAAAIAAVETP